MSQYFALSEFLHSDTALAQNIENLPTWEDVDRLMVLANTMESIRALLGDKPIQITSGFRNAQLNACVGGVPDSAHLTGQAVDFVCPAYGTPSQIVALLKSHVVGLQIDQLIDEEGWVHVGLCEGHPRYQCFKV